MDELFHLDPQQDEDLILSQLEKDDEETLLNHIFGVRV